MYPEVCDDGKRSQGVERVAMVMVILGEPRSGKTTLRCWQRHGTHA
jgi:hypothetical protein